MCSIPLFVLLPNVEFMIWIANIDAIHFVVRSDGHCGLSKIQCCWFFVRDNGAGDNGSTFDYFFQCLIAPEEKLAVWIAIFRFQGVLTAGKYVWFAPDADTDLCWSVFDRCCHVGHTTTLNLNFKDSGLNCRHRSLSFGHFFCCESAWGSQYDQSSSWIWRSNNVGGTMPATTDCDDMGLLGRDAL